jgi:hypothetical protein
MHINEPLLSAPIPAQARPHSGVNHQRGPGGSGSGSDISDGINNPPQPQGYADPYAQQYNTPYNPQQSVDYSRPGHGYNASADYDQYRPPSGTQPGRDHWVDESAYNGTNYRGGY